MTGPFDLRHADRAPVGGKAAALARLIRAGFSVPPGFVIPHDSLSAFASDSCGEVEADNAAGLRARIQAAPWPVALREQVEHALTLLTDSAPTRHVAVRSSSNREDGHTRSAAGQHDTVLAVRGAENVCRAIQVCWSSLWTDRAIAYRRNDAGPESLAMSVVVQQFLDADVSGVMFTEPGLTTIEACRGLGEVLVQGRVSPERWTLHDGRVGNLRPAEQTDRLDRHGDRLVTTPLAAPDRTRPCLTGDQVERLHRLGEQLTARSGAGVDVEWAIVEDTVWLLQCRPVTAPLPPSGRPARPDDGATVHTGLAASRGVATGTARVVRSPGGFTTLAPGEVLVCQVTDPAWTPLFSIAAAVVTETGGVLSHAAIVARELGIPAVVGLARATDLLARLPTVTVDGDRGQVRLSPAPADR